MSNTRIGTMVVTLMAVFAVSAVASATASASLPEQVPASGKFTVKSEKGTFETIGKESIKCSSDKGEGEITGPKTDKSKLTFEVCVGPLGVKCNSSGASSGDISIEINSELVWLNKAKEEVGEDLVLAKEVTIKCTALQTLKVKGSTVCPVAPTNTKTTTFTITCKQKEGKQEFTEYENEAGTKIKDITETEGSGSQNLQIRAVGS